MTVIHVEAGKHLYGGALQVFYLMRGLADKPVRSVLVCPEGSAIAKAANGVVDKVYAVPMGGDLDIGFVSRLRKIIRAEHADIVHLHSRRGADVLGAVAAYFEKTKCIVSRRVDNPEKPWIAKLKYRLFDQVVTISNGIRDVLLSEGIAPDHVVCVHSAVDVEKFSKAPDRDWFLKEFDLPDNAKALAVIAQLIYRKGHRHLLAALPTVLEQHPEAYILLFGKGPLDEDIEAEIAALGFQGRVRLIGFRDDLDRVIPCLYGVVHPADMEGLGVSLLQAAAASVPVIGTNAGGIPEIVRNEQNGLLIEPKNVDQLRDAMLRLLGDGAQAKQWGQTGNRIVNEEFSIKAMVEGNFRVYQELMAR